MRHRRQPYPKAYAAWVGNLRGLRGLGTDPDLPVPRSEVQDQVVALITKAVADGISTGIDDVWSKYGGAITFVALFFGVCTAVTTVASVVTAAAVSNGR